MIKRTKKVMAAIIVAMMVVTTTSYTVFAADDDKWTEATKGEAWNQWCEKWETIKNDWTQLSLTPGEDATQLNFAWYSVTGEENPSVKVSRNSDMSDSKTFNGNQSSAVPGYVSNKVTVNGLEENTTYYYSYGTNDNWSEAVKFQTQSTDKFGFILVGDPQIGSSSGNIASGETTEQGQDNATRNDTFNWNNTINKALGQMPNASFILSAGDQIQSRNKKAVGIEALEYTGNEIEYAGYLSADALTSLPVATSLGNHDAVSGNYSYHFNNPNASSLGSMSDKLGNSINGDYYYRYGNTLFIMLNTNNTNTAEHKTLIEEAVAENEDATWRVVTLHQDIYGSAEHSNEPAIAELRYNLVPIFEENKVDIVLTGHDHAYARTQILKGGRLSEGSSLMDEDKFDEIAEEEYKEGNLSTDEEYLSYLEMIGDEDAIVSDLSVRGNNISNPDGILYITAGSSTGSKYYNNLARKQAYIANRWQEYAPTFSTINIDDVSLSISTYRTDTMEKIDDTVTLVKSVEYENLVQIIEESEEKVVEKEKYTSSTWEAFEATLKNAQEAVAGSNISEEVVTEVYGNLKAAMDQLVLRGDVVELESEIEIAEKLVEGAVEGTEEGQYPKEAKEVLVVAINTAKAVCSSNDSSQAVIDEALEKLKAEIETFKSKVVVKKPATGGTGNNNGSTNNNTSTSNNNTSTSTNKPSSDVKTGDSSNVMVYGILGLAIVGLAGLGLGANKKKNIVK
ncbi:metallophosphoesterase [Clostridioides difficile]